MLTESDRQADDTPEKENKAYKHNDQFHKEARWSRNTFLHFLQSYYERHYLPSAKALDYAHSVFAVLAPEVSTPITPVREVVARVLGAAATGPCGIRT